MEEEEVSVEEELSNYKVGFEIVKIEYEKAISRFKEMDNKFNMLLVFSAGEIAAFGAVFQLFSENLKIIFACLFLPFLLVAVILNFVGLFTKKIILINTEVLHKKKTYNVKSLEFYGISIKTYNESINSIEKVIKTKGILFNLSLIFVLISLVVFSIFIIIL